MHLSRVGISVAVGITAALWALYLYLFEGRLPIWSDLSPFSFVVGGLALLGLWFEQNLWRTSLIRRLVSRPDLEGTWKGQLVTTYDDPESGEPLPPITCYLAVTQTYSTLQMRLLTGESNSWLISDDLSKSSKGGGYQVVGVYTNHPKAALRERSGVHFGALWLDTHGDDRVPTAMSGEYWTDRETKGSITLNQRIDKVFSHFDQAEAAFSEAVE